MENLVYHGLKDSGAVGHSKEHHERFKEAAVGTEGHLPFVPRLDAYIIEVLVDVKFHEVPGSAELKDEFGDEREKVSVLDSYGIQYAIVLDQPERTIFLLNEEHWGCNRGFGKSDPFSMEVLLQKSIQPCLL